MQVLILPFVLYPLYAIMVLAARLQLYFYISFRKTDYVGKGVVCFYYIIYVGQNSLWKDGRRHKKASAILAPDIRR